MSRNILIRWCYSDNACNSFVYTTSKHICSLLRLNEAYRDVMLCICPKECYSSLVIRKCLLEHLKSIQTSEIEERVILSESSMSQELLSQPKYPSGDNRWFMDHYLFLDHQLARNIRALVVGWLSNGPLVLKLRLNLIQIFILEKFTSITRNC